MGPEDLVNSPTEQIGTDIAMGRNSLPMWELQSECNNYQFSTGHRNKDLAVCLLSIIERIQQVAGTNTMLSTSDLQNELSILVSKVNNQEREIQMLRNMLEGMYCRRCGETFR